MDTIRICFKDGNEDVIPEHLYTDYEYHSGWFIVRKENKYIASYNMDDVKSITVGKIQKKWNDRKGIKLFFRDYKKFIIPKKKYTGVEYVGNLFIVKRNTQWIGIYNKDCLTAIVTG